MNTATNSGSAGASRGHPDLSYERIDALMQRGRRMRAEAVAGLIASLVRPFGRRSDRASGARNAGAPSKRRRAA